MGLRKAFQRLRHGRGFGVHSPYAYRFITEVLHQPHSYYAYAHVPDDILSAHDWKLLVRLAVHFRPKTIALGPGVPSRVGRFVHKIVPRARFGDSPDLLIAFNQIPQEYEKDVCAGDLHAIVLNSKSMPDAADRCHGMVFGNGKEWVMCAYPHLPAQNFDVGF